MSEVYSTRMYIGLVIINFGELISTQSRHADGVII